MAERPSRPPGLNTPRHADTKPRTDSLPAPFVLPGSFLLGTATSGLQVEGGDRNNSWYVWASEKGVLDGSSPLVANDHWNRLEEDTALMKQLGLHTHRFGVEWARVEPSRNHFDASALGHYRREVELMREAGIVPMVTLHHFSNPLWIEESGGWLRSDIDTLFATYVRRVVEALGDLVTDWITINEPNVYLYEGFVAGEWPPGRTSVRDYLRGARKMVRAHERAFETIHALQASAGRAARVGVAHHIRPFVPASHPGSRVVAALWDRLFHRRFVDPMSRCSDFLGINYYTREVVTAALKPSNLFGTMKVPDDAATSDLGWEIYPEGLEGVVTRLYRRHGLPVYITENGICVSDDGRRARFIFDHLTVVSRLIDAGVPVERYYHWTLMDNFEWALGESAPFGLYSCDFATQERRLRPSGEFYRDICRARGVTASLITRYLDSR